MAVFSRAGIRKETYRHTRLYDSAPYVCAWARPIRNTYVAYREPARCGCSSWKLISVQYPCHMNVQLPGSGCVECRQNFTQFAFRSPIWTLVRFQTVSELTPRMHKHNLYQDKSTVTCCHHLLSVCELPRPPLYPGVCNVTTVQLQLLAVDGPPHHPTHAPPPVWHEVGQTFEERMRQTTARHI